MTPEDTGEGRRDAVSVEMNTAVLDDWVLGLFEALTVKQGWTAEQHRSVVAIARSGASRARMKAFRAAGIEFEDGDS